MKLTPGVNLTFVAEGNAKCILYRDGAVFLDGTYKGSLLPELQLPDFYNALVASIPELSDATAAPTDGLVVYSRGLDGGVRLTVTSDTEISVDGDVFSFCNGTVVVDQRSSEALRRDLDFAVHNALARALPPGVQGIIQAGAMPATWELECTERRNTFEILSSIVESYASLHRLRKTDAHVYKPVEGHPCAYELFGDDLKSSTFVAFINEVFQDDPVFKRSHANVKNLVTFLKDFVRLALFPQLVTHNDYISFRNGLLHLTERKFYCLDEIKAAGLGDIVARKHIPLDFTGSTECPTLDRILDHQFDPEVKFWLQAIMGRCLFRHQQLDNWEVAPFLFGEGGTGKSMVIGTVHGTYRDDQIGTFSTKKDGHFALMSYIEKDILTSTDMPEDITKAVDEADIKKMISGKIQHVTVLLPAATCFYTC